MARWIHGFEDAHVRASAEFRAGVRVVLRVERRVTRLDPAPAKTVDSSVPR